MLLIKMGYQLSCCPRESVQGRHPMNLYFLRAKHDKNLDCGSQYGESMNFLADAEEKVTFHWQALFRLN